MAETYKPYISDADSQQSNLMQSNIATTDDALVVSFGSKCVELLKAIWPTNGAGQSIAALDGLRGIAVILVVVFHTIYFMSISPTTSAVTLTLLTKTQPVWNIASSGVHLFFVLSGFLLFMPYARFLFGIKKAPNTRGFYLRRALRILPAYWVSLFLIVIFVNPEFASLSQWRTLILHFFLLQNLNLDTWYGINPPFWTMAIESQFYLLLPIMASGLTAIMRRFGIKWVVTALLFPSLLSPSYFLLEVALKHKFPFLYNYVSVVSLLGYLVVFTLGMLCSLIYISTTEGSGNKFNWTRIEQYTRISAIISLGLLIIYIAALLTGVLSAQIDWVLRHDFLGVVYGSLLLGCLLGWRSWFRFLAHPVLRFIGTISYSLYIWHMIAIGRFLPVAASFGGDIVTLVITLIFAALVLVPCCFVFYSLFEKPFFQKRRAARE